MTSRHVLIAAGGLVAMALAGFIWFMADALRPAPPPPPADGIVALTGGADRIATALRLLQQGKARLLLISGVGPGATLAGLGRDNGIDAAQMQADITLGRQATTTIGNAAETAAWAGQNGIHSLIVVTAFYHMPRALLELGRDMPGAHLYPAPVMPGRLWQRPASAVRLLAGEYAKYLLAATWLSRLGRATT
jgi:uncharacterized SAM-binding protein YcdF (DUF218 family)